VWWGLGVFVLGQALTLGLIHINYLQYSFVADHFMYLSSVGLFLLIGLLLDRLARANPARRSMVALLHPGLGVLHGLLTHKQDRVWAGPEPFWRHTLAANPDCYAGQFNLGNYYFARKQYDLALPCYVASARIDPTMIIAHRSAARSYSALGRTDDAIASYQRAIEAQRRKEPTGVSVRLEFAAYLQSLGRLGEALAVYESVLETRPGNAKAMGESEKLRRQIASPASSGGS